jgi:NADPH:quinone reductase-like Zn-dependent oxidoreductase
LDSLLVNTKSGQPDGGYGFIPGRSFVGRAIECGFDIRGIAKGDWVFGLLSLQSSGALAEFIVVDKRRIFQSPQPHRYLTLEQIAMLPLAGIPAYRASRTLASVMTEDSSRPRALVLNAHDGIGALAAQCLTLKGADVVAQVPPPPEGGKPPGMAPPEKAKLFGAVKVTEKEPRQAIADSTESEYDFVLDTVGGSNIWHAARTVLRNNGQFTTVIGDSQALPSMNAHIKSNFRSLRRAFTKKDNKSIGYEWISQANEVDHHGEDIRDALIAIRTISEKSELVPFVTKVIPFEDAPQAFESTSDCFKNSGTVVVRITEW